jgi:hypothetical protein
MSPIWRVIAALNEIGQISCNIKVYNGMYTKFSLDRWYFDNALASTYHRLFSVCINPTIFVFKIIVSQG